MPGSMFELECPGCGRVHSLHTGASYCLAHGKEWEFEQWVCTACKTIVSWANMTCSCQGGNVSNA